MTSVNTQWPCATYWASVCVENSTSFVYFLPSSKAGCTGCTLYTQPLKMELIQGSETLAKIQFDAGEIPRRKYTIFKSWRKSEIKKFLERLLYIFFWVFPRRQIVVGRRFGTLYQFNLQRLGVHTHTVHPAFEDGTDREFRNVGQLQFDAGEIPKRNYRISCCFICKRFSVCSSNNVWCLVACLCGRLFVLTNRTENVEISGRTATNVSHKQNAGNTNVKSGVNKLIANIRFHFVANMVIRGEISVQNPNGQCSIGFLFSSGFKKYLVYLWQYGTALSITSLCSFF